MLAFTLIRARGPDPWERQPPELLGRKAPASCAAREKIPAQTAIAPAARTPGRGVLHRQRTASLLTRDAIAVMHVNLTVKMSAAASELLASRLVPSPAAVENLAVSMTWADRDAVPTGE